MPRDGRLRIAREDAAEQAAIQQAAVLVTMIAEEALAGQAAIFWAALRAGAVREVDREARTTQWRAADGLAATVQTVVSTTVLRRRALCHVALRDGREFGEGSSISWFQTVPTCQRLCAEVKAGYVARRNGWAFGEGSSISWVQTVLTYQRLCVELVAEETEAILRLSTEAAEVLGRL